MKKSNSMYCAQLEHDSCGIGFIANLNGEKEHAIVSDSLKMLANMEHRGGCGADGKTGDGAGVLTQIPFEFLRSELSKKQLDLPSQGEFGTGLVFFHVPDDQLIAVKELMFQTAEKIGLEIFHYRQVPVDIDAVGVTAASTAPLIEQVFIKGASEEVLERKLFIFRKFVEKAIKENFKDSEIYFPSLSGKTIVYKGQFRTDQVDQFYLDLQNDAYKSQFAIIHSRFSTNTFPKWKLAQPFRFIAHNGEINTIRGNVNKMSAKEAFMASDNFTPEELQMIFPVCDPENSDSANLDSIIELLVLSGRSIEETMLLLVPEAWQDNENMDKGMKAFYKYFATIMEPWDGPASISFTDGKKIGARLDRNGLRPSRYCITKSGRVIMSSEAGSLKVPQEDIVFRERLQPGKIFVADLETGKIITDKEVKSWLKKKNPYQQWIRDYRVKLRLIEQPDNKPVLISNGELLAAQKLFGITREDEKKILSAMAESGTEPLGSMGIDAPLAALSENSQHVSSYFKQLFAQVSNPPIDPIRERLVMSLFTQVGKSGNILENDPEHCRQLHISQPVLSWADFENIQRLEDRGFVSAKVYCHFDLSKGETLEAAILKVCEKAEKRINEGANVLILSDKGYSENKVPIPSLLFTGAVHHYLTEKNIRANAGIVVEAGDCWETHHFATLAGYGAAAVYPYMAFDTLENLYNSNAIQQATSLNKAFRNYTKAINYGLLKIMSKMGISTLQSYQSAQIFEIVGLNESVVEQCFKGTVSRIKGLGYDALQKEVMAKHAFAYSTSNYPIEFGGVYQWNRRGEKHLFNPETIHLLQKSTKLNDYQLYKKYAEKINNQGAGPVTLRGLFRFRKAAPVPIEEVETVESIYKRFATGAMSFGSISYEAHSTLAVAMNRIGGKSNSGEGGEDESRFTKKENGDWERSAIKQVASGRFGVTSNYLANAEEIQIKMAQGAKPGEGGQLPGHKVDNWIGRVRNSTPGVGLISPPPHHDIYSIEDLAQLIYDLKNANRKARINVKLVSEAGVGTIAAGVAKAKADVILVSGYDGGTGASPISSIRHAGLPWELGLAEAHQTLVMNGLRNRIVLQADGQMKTGRDLAIAALLGAEEWGVATAALVAEGCIMMRKCHLNTCPVGIATQDKNLRKLFTGKAEDVMNLFKFMATELREVMAALGFRTVEEMVGRADLLEMNPEVQNWKTELLDLSPVLASAGGDQQEQFNNMQQDHELEQVLDRQLIKYALPAIQDKTSVELELPIENVNRSVGTMLSNEISKVYGSKGLPEDTASFIFRGSAGQSFGAFTPKGVTFRLLGESNDYFGKGLSGSKLIVQPDWMAGEEAQDQIIIGNVALMGATSGKVFINGMAGERFAVRNSGASAVVEGVGDHGCEYMTGGRVVVIGKTGKNFAAGMSGGIAYVYDPEDKFVANCNTDMVLFEPVKGEAEKELTNMLKDHIGYTDSNKAKWILGNWENEKHHFIKVIPEDYKRVLEANEKELVKVG